MSISLRFADETLCHEDDGEPGREGITREEFEVIRSEQRRRQRQQIATNMNPDEPPPDAATEHVELAMETSRNRWIATQIAFCWPSPTF